jgi:hypothetical protein
MIALQQFLERQANERRMRAVPDHDMVVLRDLRSGCCRDQSASHLDIFAGRFGIARRMVALRPLQIRQVTFGKSLRS